LAGIPVPPKLIVEQDPLVVKRSFSRQAKRGYCRAVEPYERQKDRSDLVIFGSAPAHLSPRRAMARELVINRQTEVVNIGGASKSFPMAAQIQNALELKSKNQPHFFSSGRAGSRRSCCWSSFFFLWSCFGRLLGT
jgi:hypothetical protein